CLDAGVGHFRFEGAASSAVKDWTPQFSALTWRDNRFPDGGMSAPAAVATTGHVARPNRSHPMNAPENKRLTASQGVDMSHWWMPFTANRQFKAKPRMVSSASGVFYKTPEGREILDATSGLWCVNAGHGREEIAEAAARQLREMDFAPSFQFGHPIGFEFANRLIDIAPEGFDKVFYANSGSEAVDTALKMALAYHRARGEAQRTRLIGRERGYHGVG